MTSELAHLVRSFAMPQLATSVVETTTIERAATAIESGDTRTALAILRAGAIDAQGPAQALAYAEAAMRTGNAALAVPVMRSWTQRQPGRADIWFPYGSAMSAVNDLAKRHWPLKTR